jgi:phage repressor protein C with HTH and peptisase S24 domain
MQARAITKLSALAAAVGVTESAISRWCHDGQMTTNNVVSLCEILSISIDWLLLGSGPMQREGEGASTSHPEIGHMIERMKPHVREHLSRFLSSLHQDIV